MIGFSWEKICCVEWYIEEKKCSCWIRTIKDSLKTLNIGTFDTMIDRYLSAKCPVREIGTISKMQKYIDTNNESNKDSECKGYSSAPKKNICKTCIGPTQEWSCMLEENERKYPLEIISSAIEIVPERESVKEANRGKNRYKAQSTHIDEIEFWGEFSLVVLSSHKHSKES